MAGCTECLRFERLALMINQTHDALNVGVTNVSTLSPVITSLGLEKLTHSNSFPASPRRKLCCAIRLSAIFQSCHCERRHRCMFSMDNCGTSVLCAYLCWKRRSLRTYRVEPKRFMNIKWSITRDSRLQSARASCSTVTHLPGPFLQSLANAMRSLPARKTIVGVSISDRFCGRRVVR